MIGLAIKKIAEPLIIASTLRLDLLVDISIAPNPI
jgi:hypothetical protein